MNNKHRKTLERVLKRPISSSIPWRDIEALFIALGGVVKEGDGSRVHVLLNDALATFHRPHPQKETDKGAVASVQRFLKEAGIHAQI